MPAVVLQHHQVPVMKMILDQQEDSCIDDLCDTHIQATSATTAMTPNAELQAAAESPSITKSFDSDDMEQGNDELESDDDESGVDSEEEEGSGDDTEEDSDIEEEEAGESDCDNDNESDYDCWGCEDEDESTHNSVYTDIPFWFNNEDAAQISAIIDSYSTTLKLGEERKSCIRAPVPFVGRVKRVQVDNDLFTTLDQISIFLRDPKPLGVSLPFSRDVWLLTSWDVVDGTPLRSFEISKESLLDFWRARSHGGYSYLYCRPTMYLSKSEWEFETSAYESPVLWASPVYSATHSFSLYLPPKQPSKSLDDMNDDLLV